MRIDLATREGVESFFPLLDKGFDQWLDTEDGRGAPPKMRELVKGMLLDGYAFMFLIVEDGRPVGFTLEYVNPGEELEGLITWIEPQSRGRGHWRECDARINEWCSHMGIKKRVFSSTLEHWKAAAPQMGWTRRLQKNGPATVYVKEVG